MCAVVDELSDGNDKNRYIDTQVHAACASECTHQPFTVLPSFDKELRIKVISTFVQWGLSHLVYLVGCLCQSSTKKYKPSCIILLALNLPLSLYGFPLVFEEKSNPCDDLKALHDLALLPLSASSLLSFSPTGFLLES